MRRTLAEGGTPRPPAGASILSRYITRVRNSFQNLGPPIPETPELTVPGTMEAHGSIVRAEQQGPRPHPTGRGRDAGKNICRDDVFSYRKITGTYCWHI